MIRLDKFLCDIGVGTRSEVKKKIQKGFIKVNGNLVLKPDFKVQEDFDMITYQNVILKYQNFYYYMFHKPAGILTATHDQKEKVVMDYLKDAPGKNLSPVGRLDKDSEGLLLITNDGELAHKLLAPKNEIPKTYYLRLKYEFTEEQENELYSGVDIGEKSICKAVAVKKISIKEIEITICEGKFHQVKRMLHAVKNEVQYLKRISFSSLYLDSNLPLGSWRLLTDKEIEELKKDL